MSDQVSINPTREERIHLHSLLSLVSLGFIRRWGELAGLKSGDSGLHLSKALQRALCLSDLKKKDEMETRVPPTSGRSEEGTEAGKPPFPSSRGKVAGFLAL